jgi:hypothetical protein
LDALVNAAKEKACSDERARLITTYFNRWEGIKSAAEQNSPLDANDRLTALESSKAKFDADLNLALDALYGSNGKCAGQKKPNDLLGIEAAYNNLVKELKTQLTAAQKACMAEKETLLKELQNKWAEAQKIAKDNRAEPEAAVRKQKADAEIVPAIAAYREKMTALYEKGICQGVGAPWTESTDAPFQKIISGWADLQRQLDGEKPVDYQDPAALKELQNAAAAAKETEQSRANRLLGGAATALSGIGGMQLMQGIAEKQSDEEGAAEMRAYQETFRCSIGDGGMFNLRDAGTAHAVPGYSAATMALKEEFRQKVAFLVDTKAALDMQPGIEATAILDTSNLYTNESFEGTVANRFDTAQQRLDGGDANKRITTGGVMLGVGVVGGAVGDMLINKKSDADNSKETETPEPRGKNAGGAGASVVDAIGGAAAGAAGTGSQEKAPKSDTKTPVGTPPLMPESSKGEPGENHPNEIEQSLVRSFAEKCENLKGEKSKPWPAESRTRLSAPVRAEYRCVMKDLPETQVEEHCYTVFELQRTDAGYYMNSYGVSTDYATGAKEEGCLLSLPWRDAL